MSGIIPSQNVDKALETEPTLPVERSGFSSPQKNQSASISALRGQRPLLNLRVLRVLSG